MSKAVLRTIGDPAKLLPPGVSITERQERPDLCATEFASSVMQRYTVESCIAVSGLTVAPEMAPRVDAFTW